MTWSTSLYVLAPVSDSERRKASRTLDRMIDEFDHITTSMMMVLPLLRSPWVSRTLWLPHLTRTSTSPRRLLISMIFFLKVKKVKALENTRAFCDLC